jgi:Lon protease-like protein
MSWLHPALQDLPAECAVFPLPGALLLPTGRLPLNIFEPRYLAMVEDSLAAGRMFGMIQPNEHAEHDPGAAEPPLYHVGCLGRLSHFAETDDGRFLITLTGICRFRVRREFASRRGYRRVAADYAPFHADLLPPPPLADGIREQVLGALRPYFASRQIDPNWDAINRMDDATLVTTLSMLCQFGPAEKQALLEADTLADRAADLLALLRMALHDPDTNSRPS